MTKYIKLANQQISMQYPINIFGFQSETGTKLTLKKPYTGWSKHNFQYIFNGIYRKKIFHTPNQKYLHIKYMNMHFP